MGPDVALALAQNELPQLTRLNISSNELGDDGADDLSGLNNLTRLDISNNRIGDDGAHAISLLRHRLSVG